MRVATWNSRTATLSSIVLLFSEVKSDLFNLGGSGAKCTCLNWAFLYSINYRPQRSWGKVIFSEACVNHSVHRGRAWLLGGHAWLLGGMHGCLGGHAWLHWGDMHVLLGGECVVLFGGCMVLFGGCAWFYLGGCVWFYSGGHAWFYLGGMHGFIWGVRGFIRGGMHGFIQGGHAWFFGFFGYNEIRSMSGRYASYWNAFLFLCAYTCQYNYLADLSSIYTRQYAFSDIKSKSHVYIVSSNDL